MAIDKPQPYVESLIAIPDIRGHIPWGLLIHG
jgi:hypothetical protein